METLISPVRRKRNSAMDVISVSKDWRKMEILCQSHEKVRNLPAQDALTGV